jgi:DNA topoisomerase-3
MKQMVDALVYEVRMESRANITYSSAKAPEKKVAKKSAGIAAEKCPKCKQGTILKGKTVYGCSQFKEGCSFRMPFDYLGKKVSEKQLIRLIQKGSTVNLKGFKTQNGKADGAIVWNDQFEFTLKGAPVKVKSDAAAPMICPKCKKGNIIKGKTAYGCANYKIGCDFKFLFETIRSKAQGKKLTKELVYSILIGKN